MTGRLLSTKGHDVSFAFNGQEALSVLTEEVAAEGKGPDFVLLDNHMPIMTGIECVRRLREMGAAGSQLLVVGLTGDAQVCGGAGGCTKCLCE